MENNIQCNKNNTISLNLKLYEIISRRLTYLYCSNNRLIILPSMPDSLIELNYQGNKLSSLINIPLRLRGN